MPAKKAKSTCFYFFSSIGMEGEPAGIAVVHLGGFGPWPTSKLGAVVIVEGLVDFFFGIHHEGPVLNDLLADGLALKQENPGFFGPVFDYQIDIGPDLHGVIRRDGLSL
jgi:hypothetical protein